MSALRSLSGGEQTSARLAKIDPRSSLAAAVQPRTRRTGILPFRFRLPLTRQLLRFGDLCRGHLLRDFISIADRILVTSRSRQAEPHVCVSIVLRHAQPRSVTEAKIDLRSNMTLICSAARPLRSLDPVLGHSYACRVQHREVEL